MPRANQWLNEQTLITTSFTFLATVEAIASVGGIPVFVDVKQDDYTIDPKKIESAISSKTKAILPVHIFGTICDMDAIMQVARKYNLKVIEDAAQAIGSEYNGRKAGTLGDVGCFSFYPIENLGGAGDGGMVTTNSDDVCTIAKAYDADRRRPAFIVSEANEIKGIIYVSFEYEKGKIW